MFLFDHCTFYRCVLSALAISDIKRGDLFVFAERYGKTQR